MTLRLTNLLNNLILSAFFSYCTKPRNNARVIVSTRSGGRSLLLKREMRGGEADRGSKAKRAPSQVEQEGGERWNEEKVRSKDRFHKASFKYNGRGSNLEEGCRTHGRLQKDRFSPSWLTSSTRPLLQTMSEETFNPFIAMGGKARAALL